MWPADSSPLLCCPAQGIIIDIDPGLPAALKFFHPRTGIPRNRRRCQGAAHRDRYAAIECQRKRCHHWRCTGKNSVNFRMAAKSGCIAGRVLNRLCTLIDNSYNHLILIIRKNHHANKTTWNSVCTLFNWDCTLVNLHDCRHGRCRSFGYL